jgi:hypothetical protein
MHPICSSPVSDRPRHLRELHKTSQDGECTPVRGVIILSILLRPTVISSNIINFDNYRFYARGSRHEKC